jgi:hypothetical protein
MIIHRVETKIFVFVFSLKKISLTKSCENFCESFRENFPFGMRIRIQEPRLLEHKNICKNIGENEIFREKFRERKFVAKTFMKTKMFAKTKFSRKHSQKWKLSRKGKFLWKQIFACFRFPRKWKKGFRINPNYSKKKKICVFLLLIYTMSILYNTVYRTCV